MTDQPLVLSDTMLLLIGESSVFSSSARCITSLSVASHLYSILVFTILNQLWQVTNCVWIQNSAEDINAFIDMYLDAWIWHKEGEKSHPLPKKWDEDN